jgi:hydroxyacid-oxoacid transhydrogenase
VRKYGVTAEGQPDYAFEMAASSIRYGRGVTAEVGMDMENLGCSNVMLITDKNMAKLPVVQIVRESLDRAGRNVAYFDDVSVEPTGTSFQAAIDFARENGCDAFVSVGGGSVMDTAKAANLFATFPDHELLDFVNAPVGKGLPVPGVLRPHIAIPTTAGTGSETTGQAIFDYEPLKQVL